MHHNDSASDLFARFDSFCKTVMRNEARNLKKMAKRLSGRERLIRDSGLFEQMIEFYDDMVELFTERIHLRGRDYAVTNENLFAALKKLPEAELEVILLIYWEELSQNEIAELLKVSSRTVYARRTRALAKLKQWVRVPGKKSNYSYDDSG